MVGLLLDVAILVMIIRTLQRHKAAKFIDIIFVAIGVTAANKVILVGFGFFMGPFGFFAYLPMLVADWLIILFFCGLTIKQTTIALGALIAYWGLSWVALALLF